jgi:hypothetical protein
MIIDSHAHLHPSDADLADWDSPNDAAALRDHQRVQYVYRRAPALTAAGETVRDAWKTLWNDEHELSWEGRTEVNFRLADGKFAWDTDGVTYTTAIRHAADAALLIKLMDAVGVDMAVLHASLPCNRYYGRAARAYPGRFLPLAYLKYEDEVEQTVEALGEAVADGMVGLFQNPMPGWGGYDDWHEPRFDPLWREVERLNLPVYAMGFAPMADYPAMLPKLKTWIERFPAIKRVLVHGFPTEVLLEDGKYRVTDLVKGLVNDYDTLVELLPWAHTVYLHDRTDELIKVLYDAFGPTKFTWGTEFIKAAPPHTPEHYAELKGYFEARCPYMSAEDGALIQGGNLQRLFGLKGKVVGRG